jgi:hypothetical protein
MKPAIQLVALLYGGLSVKQSLPCDLWETARQAEYLRQLNFL